MGDVDKVFTPTRIGWLTMIPQRIRGGATEEKDVLQKFKQMKKIRKQLRLILRQLEAWRAQMKKLYTVSKKLGKAIETNEKAVKDASWNADLYLKDKVAINNIKEKISKLDQLLAQKKLLKYIKLKEVHAEQKLHKLRKQEKRESYERQSTRYLSIQKEAVQQRDDVLAEVLTVIDKCLAEVKEFGSAYLIKPQLQSFKMSQFQMFLATQQMFQGKVEDSHLVELEEHWHQFTNRVAEELPKQRAKGSLDGSHPFLREALEEPVRKISDFSDEEGGEDERPIAHKKGAKKDKKVEAESVFEGDDISEEVDSLGEVVKVGKKGKGKKKIKGHQVEVPEPEQRVAQSLIPSDDEDSD